MEMEIDFQAMLSPEDWAFLQEHLRENDKTQAELAQELVEDYLMSGR